MFAFRSEDVFSRCRGSSSDVRMSSKGAEVYLQRQGRLQAVQGFAFRGKEGFWRCRCLPLEVRKASGVAGVCLQR